MILFIFLYSCTPVNYTSTKETTSTNIKKTETETKKEETDIKISKQNLNIGLNTVLDKALLESNIQQNVTFIASTNDDKNILNQFVNVIELAVYEKKFKNLTFEIKYYENYQELKNFLNTTDKKGKIFIGPINSLDTEVVNYYCNKGSIFFSFSSNKKLANECTYLVNFFPDNELKEV